ncbi:42622_t:CDS:2 [Gigaspora margarita]|uniref:42622_t:CDS:1 n=1 Tax=Gigaspora margarita TaxID=4874 RepID=A0ABN7VQ57_GIGMA|nr:42622_t:CDS:2 [Gigaspora margarita]
MLPRQQVVKLGRERAEVKALEAEKAARFLGIWITAKDIYKQCINRLKKETFIFTSLVKNKQISIGQMKYLNNKEPEGKPKTIIEVLVEHDRLKNWKKLKEGELIENITLENINTRKVKEKFKTQSPNSLALKPQRKPISKKKSKCEWVIVDKNKENQPIIGRVITKKTHITDIICYESSSKNEKQTGERSSNKVLQERLSNGVKKARTEKLIDILPWVKYTKGDMNLQLKPDYFVKQEKGSSISSEQVRSLRSRKEEIKNERADQIAKEGGEVDVPTRVIWVMTEGMIFWPVWKGIKIECSPREFIKQLLMTATRAEWTFNQGLYDKIHQKRVWIKKEEEILKNIKEKLRQKDKIALCLDKLREVFISRDIKEYEE